MPSARVYAIHYSGVMIERALMKMLLRAEAMLCRRVRRYGESAHDTRVCCLQSICAARGRAFSYGCGAEERKEREQEARREYARE